MAKDSGAWADSANARRWWTTEQITEHGEIVQMAEDGEGWQFMGQIA
jgi:hypothetical protein